jgi:hypothetical protein
LGIFEQKAWQAIFYHGLLDGQNRVNILGVYPKICLNLHGACSSARKKLAFGRGLAGKWQVLFLILYLILFILFNTLYYILNNIIYIKARMVVKL